MQQQDSTSANPGAAAGNVFGIMPSILFLPVTSSVAVAYVQLSAGPLAYYMCARARVGGVWVWVCPSV